MSLPINFSANITNLKAKIEKILNRAKFFKTSLYRTMNTNALIKSVKQTFVECLLWALHCC